MALLLALALQPRPAAAHDASSWGGLFRSSDGGATWFQANQGRLIGGVLAIAVDPRDRTHLLIGTDDSLLVSHNGGLDWEPTLDAAPPGPVFAIAIDRQGRQLAATDGGLFRSDDGQAWRAQPPPAGSSPVRGLLGGDRDGRVYLLGWHGLFRSDDWGDSWMPITAGLPAAAAFTSLVAVPGRAALLGVVDGQVWQGDADGKAWTSVDSGLPDGHIQVLAGDPSQPGTVWAAGDDRVFQSIDGGASWHVFGQALPDADTEIRGIAQSTDRRRVVISTHRGVYLSDDAGLTWSSVSDNLPAHIEAGPLLRDPAQADTVYVGFALTPYAEQWRRAAEGRSAVGRLTLMDLAGATALLVLVGLGGGMALQWLGRHRSPPVLESVP